MASLHEEPTAVMTVEEQSGVDVGLRQRSALMPLRFMMVMNFISGNLSQYELLNKILYDDHLTLMADGKEELQT